jgi:acyl carrier protein
MTEAQTRASVREILLAGWPGRFDDAGLDDDVMLGEDGLGLDSIDVVEFLLGCEEALGGPGTQELLLGGPISLRTVVAHFSAA